MFDRIADSAKDPSRLFTAAPTPSRRYRAFISYKHGRSRVFAERLESALMAYAKPLLGRPIAIFRDERHLRPGIDLPALIRSALTDSDFLIVLASPEAAASPWVNDELAIWCGELRRADKLIVVLTAGTIGVEPATKRIDWSRTDALPTVLKAHLETVPLYVDMTGARDEDLDLHHPTFKQQVNLISARLRDFDPNEMAGEEMRTYRRNRRLRNGALFAIGSLGLGLVAAGWRARQQAERVSRTAAQADFDLATLHLEEGASETPRVIAHLARAMRSRPDESRAAQLLVNLLTQRVWVTPLGPALSHEGRVFSACFSPDGRRVVTASDDRTARVWSVATGRAIGAPLRHDEAVTFATFSPDGTRVATASNDHTARLWDASTSQPLGEPMRHEHSVTSAAFSPDGKTVLTIAHKNSIAIWDGVSGKPIVEPTLPPGIMISAAFVGGNRVVATSYRWDHKSPDHKGTLLLLQDVTTKQRLCEPLPHPHWIGATIFNARGDRVAALAYDTAQMWDLTTGEKVGAPMPHAESIALAAFSPDETTLVTGSGRTARLWNTATGEAVGRPMEHDAALLAVSFSPDGRRVVSASEDKTARIWDAESGRPVAEPMRHEGGVCTASFSADSRRIVTASFDQTAQLWDACATRALGQPLRHGQVRSATFSPDGGKILTASQDGTARLWDARTGAQIGESLQHQHWVLTASFSADGQHVVTGSADKTARTWDAATGRPLGESMRHVGEVRSATFGRDGRRIMTGSDDGVSVWDAVSGQRIGDPIRTEGGVVIVALSATGKHLVTLTNKWTVQLWDVESRSAVVLSQPPATSVCFSPSGTALLTVSTDNAAQLWEASTGRQLAGPLRHEDQILSACFDAEGTRIVTASADKTARVWSASDGQAVGEPMKHADRVKSARFSSDGRSIVTASDDGSVRFWDAASGRPLGERVEEETPLFAGFSPDGKRLLTIHQGRVHVWEVRFPTSAPSWFADWVERIGGRRLAASGALEPVTRSVAVPASVSRDDFYGRVARWFGTPAPARAISPFSSKRIRDWVREPIADGRGFDAYAALPGDPLTVVAEAERAQRNEPSSTLADFYADYAISRASVNAEDEDDKAIRPRQAEIHFRAARVWLARAQLAAALADRDAARAKGRAVARTAMTLDPSRDEYRALAEELASPDTR
jgi:WD40 repeat protein